jgi:CRISPR system Cascade subunit CasE
MEDLCLHSLAVDIRAATELARRQRLIGDRDSRDDGYMTHAVLAAALGESAPRPFVLEHELDPARVVDRDATVLAYSSLSLDELMQVADEEYGRIISWERSRAVVVPDVEAGAVVPFTTRVAPIVRSRAASPDREGHGRGHGREMDAFLAECIRVGRDVKVSREAVYRDWLQRQLGDAADVHRFELRDSRRAVAMRRGYRGQEHRERHYMSLSTAIMRGSLLVRDERAFRAVMTRGLGRHRSFGLGMMLVGEIALRARA